LLTWIISVISLKTKPTIPPANTVAFYKKTSNIYHFSQLLYHFLKLRGNIHPLSLFCLCFDGLIITEV